MKTLILTISTALVGISAIAASLAQPPPDRPGKPLAGVLAQLQPRAVPAGGASARRDRLVVATDPDGSVCCLGAPTGYHFISATRGAPAETVARRFLEEHRTLFGVSNQLVTFPSARSIQTAQRHYLRLHQHYAGVPVFGATAAVQVNLEGGIDFVLAGFARELEGLPVTPSIEPVTARAFAESLFAPRAPGRKITATTPALSIFAPSLLEAPGQPRLAWEIEVSVEGLPHMSRRVLLDAHTLEIIREYPLTVSALNRLVFDAANTSSSGTLRRVEGQPPSGYQEVDNAYLFLGNTYNFYHDNFARDSINSNGNTLSVTVRYCDPSYVCPLSNAWYDYSDSRFYFGDHFAVADITAHEYTHGVTHFSSDLIYEGTSGAINESISDVFGRFVDLTYNPDNSTNRWLFGHDQQAGGSRDMRHPPAICDSWSLCGTPGTWCSPDRWGSTNYHDVLTPSDCNDYGFVHYNSGVNNKLCYLLTDGDTFNGQTVTGMGIGPVAQLYYEANTHLLIPTSSWRYLQYALMQASLNLGWTDEQRNNLERACLAVEISGVHVDGLTSCGSVPDGSPNCHSPSGRGGPYKRVFDGRNQTTSGDFLFIKAGTYKELFFFQRPMTVMAEGGPVFIGQ
jgi:bacillolysin